MKLVLGAYSQEPQGASASVLERLLSSVLRPLLNYLYHHPDVYFELYLSSYEIEWLESTHPEINMLIKELCRREQLEMLTGSFTQAYLSAIPAWERPEQVERMTTQIRKKYSRRSETLWLFDQLWSPALVNVLNLSGLSNVIISSYDRLQDKVLETSPFVMDEVGRSANIFPIDDRYAQAVEEFGRGNLSKKDFFARIESLRPQRDGDATVVFLNADQLAEGASDGGQIFARIAENYALRGVKTAPLDFTPSRDGYLPAGWYGRDAAAPECTCFQDMVTKNPRLSHIASMRLSLEDLYRAKKGPKLERRNLENSLMKISSGAVYSSSYDWPQQRDIIGRNFMEVREMLQAPSYQIFDRNSVLIQTKNLIAVLSEKGGALSELDYLPAKSSYAKNGRLFTDSVKIAASTKSRSLEAAHFTNEAKDKRGDSAVFSYTGQFGKKRLKIEKTFAVRSNIVMLNIAITNLSPDPVELDYSLSLPVSDGGRGILPPRREESSSDLQKTVKIIDEPNSVNLNLACDKPFSLIRESITGALKGESFYLGTLINPSWNVKIDTAGVWTLAIGLRLDLAKK